MRIRDAVQQYARSLAGRSPHTRRTYMAGVSALLAWLEREHKLQRHHTTRRMPAGMIEGLYLRRLEDGVKPASARAAANGASSFVAWLDEHDELEKTSATRERRRYRRVVDRQPYQQPRVNGEAERIISAARQAAMPQSSWGRRTRIRDMAVLELLYCTGLRRAELASVRTAELDLEERRVMVRGKGGKTRYVFLSEEAVEAVRLYVEDTGTRYVAGTAGEAGERRIYRIVKRWAKKAGVRGFAPHGFRHALATRLLRAGMEPTAIQWILGHASVDTTLEFYAAYRTGDLQEQFEKYERSPNGR